MGGSPTASMAPTDCFETNPPKVIEYECVGGDDMTMPPNAIIIQGQHEGTDKIGITVSQMWSASESGLAIRPDLDSCIVQDNVPFGESADEVYGECIDGYTSLAIVVYLDPDFEPENCAACNADDLLGMGGNYNFCAYRVEVPCEPMTVECGEPSASPSGSYFPSSAPSETPTDSVMPSDGPSLTPSDSPTGGPTASPSDMPSDGPSLTPSGSPSDMPSDGPSLTPSGSPFAMPSDGPSLMPSDGPSMATSSPTTSPTTSPTDPPSVDVCPPDDPISISQDGETMYPAGEQPVKITFQNTTHVGFEVVNTLGGTASSVFTQWHAGSFGETECVEDENVEKGVTIETEFLAQCMHHTKVSIINVWITNCDNDNIWLDEIDDAEVPECCHPGDQCRTVEYQFKLPCINPCPDDEDEDEGDLPAAESMEAPEGSYRQRHLAASSTHQKIAEHKKDKEIEMHAGTTEEFEAIAGHVELQKYADDHFCAAEDYPCGPNGDKVYACHYSAKEGYK